MGRVLDTLFLTTGDEVYAFEREFAEYLGVPDVVTVSSCTAALHLSLVALGIGPGDEVITTAMTFIARRPPSSTPAPPRCSSMSMPTTGNIDPATVEAAITPRTKAIIAVHLYGTMVDITRSRDIADRHGLALIEDAAHCVEGMPRRPPAGPARRRRLLQLLRHQDLDVRRGRRHRGHATRSSPTDCARIRLHGMSKNAADRYHGKYEHWDMVALGLEGEPDQHPGSHASAAAEQAGRTPSAAGRHLPDQYDSAVDAIDGVGRPIVPAGVVPARHLYTVWIADDRRDAVLQPARRQGIGTAVNYRAIHQLTWLRENLDLALPAPERRAHRRPDHLVCPCTTSYRRRSRYGVHRPRSSGGGSAMSEPHRDRGRHRRRAAGHSGGSALRPLRFRAARGGGRPRRRARGPARAHNRSVARALADPPTENGFDQLIQPRRGVVVR